MRMTQILAIRTILVKKCLTHGWCTHSTKECSIVKQQRAQYNSRNRVPNNSSNSKHEQEHINNMKHNIETQSRNSSQQRTEYDNTEYDEDYCFDDESD